MNRLEKIIVTASIGASLIAGAVSNIHDYTATIQRFRTAGNNYTAETKLKAKTELETSSSLNPLKFGYRLALKDYVRECQEAESVGVI